MPAARASTDIARERLVSQHLLAPRHDEPDAIVAALGAVQAQDYPGAVWAIAQRSTSPLTEATIDRAVDEGRMLRTHVLRPTWHLVAPADIRWMLDLTGLRVIRTMATYDARLGLDANVFRKARRAIERALDGGRAITRAEMKKVLERIGIETSVQRTAHVLMNAELEGLICSGPRRGKQATYALLDERAPNAKSQTKDESLHELARRYFATRSPATVQDFSWWSGLVAADARRAIDLLGSAIRKVEIEGKPYYTSVQARKSRKGSKRAWLLPNYDEFFIGYRDRSALGTYLRSVPQEQVNATLFAHVVVIDGQLVGGWQRVIGAKGVRLTIRPLVRLAKDDKAAIEKAAARYAAFLDRPLSALTYDTPDPVVLGWRLPLFKSVGA